MVVVLFMDRQISSGSEAQVTRIFYSECFPIPHRNWISWREVSVFINEIAYLYNHGMIIDSKQVNKKCILAIHRKMSICLTFIFLTLSVTHSWISSKLILAYPFSLPLFWFMTHSFGCTAFLTYVVLLILSFQREGFPVSDQLLSCIKFLVSHFPFINSTTIND